MEIYLDNSATTKPCSLAVSKAEYAMTECYGNPSSLHEKGLSAERLLEDTREIIAKSLSAEKSEIFFTPSGTVANNTAIFGAVNALKRRGNKIVTTAFEHPSVQRCMDKLAEDGFEVVRLIPDSDGNISVRKFENAVDENTILVSVMAVNNETGSILPFDKIKKIIKRKNSPALLHIDAVQAYMKIPLKPSVTGADFMSMSAHKIHGLKGAGALYKNKAVRIKPYILGGGQENNICSGTQGLPAIAAFGGAVESFGSTNRRLEAVRELNSYLRQKISKTDGIEINSPENALPYIINLSLSKIPSQVSVNYFSMNGIYISAGSACSKGHRSDTLVSMGLSPERIDTAVRVSLSYETTRGEIDGFVKTAQKALSELRKK